MIMLLCFGSAWPLSIMKSVKSRTAKGKSFFFLIILLCGYTSGIIYKAFYNYDGVIILYVCNFIMVSIDTMLYIRNKKIDELQN